MKPRGYYSYQASRILLGAVFVYAGMLKALDVPAFAGQVAAYQLLPYQWNYVAAAALPCVEILAGGLLISGFRVRAAALTIAGMTGMFIILLLSVLVRGLEIDCGCFGPQVQSTPLQALLRNVLLIAMAHFVFHLHNRYAAAPTA
jgi:uncharacterized membrane protein YkgB